MLVGEAGGDAAAWGAVEEALELEQRYEIVHREPRGANERAQCAHGKLLMLRYGEIGARA